MADRTYLGKTGLTELINLIWAEFQKKQDWMQFPEMPAASKYVGKVIQYTGTTNNDFTKGYFYYSNGVSWAQVNVMSAVVICKTALPDWTLADPGLIYYVTSENKAYVRDNETEGNWFDLAGGSGASAFLIVSALPLWTDADPNKIYLLVGSDGTTCTAFVKASTLGKWYKLGGGSGAQIVTALPTWAAADASTVYYLIDGSKIKGYVKNESVTDAWYELAGGANFVITDALPTWLSADPATLYFLKNSDGTALTGYVKDADHIDKWFKIGGASAIVKRYAESVHYDKDAAYNETGVEFDLDGTEFVAFKDDEIEELYDEA